MANANSNLIANIVANPPVHNHVGVSGGRVRVMADTFTSSGWAVANDTITLCRLPSNARIWSIRIATGDLGSGASAIFDLGLWTSGPDATVEHDDDKLLFANDVACADPVAATDTTGMIELAWQVDADGSNVGKRLWELTNQGNNTEDPQITYDLCMQAGHNNCQDGVVSFVVLYTID